MSDTDEKPLDVIISTATWGYLASAQDCITKRRSWSDWMKRVQEQKWKDAFVFFKHEDEGIGPKLAAQFIALAKNNPP